MQQRRIERPESAEMMTATSMTMLTTRFLVYLLLLFFSFFSSLYRAVVATDRVLFGNDDPAQRSRLSSPRGPRCDRLPQKSPSGKLQVHTFVLVGDLPATVTMQQEGTPKFLKFHQGSVRGVAFSPRDRYLFCSGGYDGKVNLYSALRMELLMCYQITPMTQAKNVNAVRFTSDGSRVLAATNTRRLVVVDVERGEQLLSYDNCAFGGRDRTGLATDPSGPNLAVSVAANGKGLTLVDLRMPLPLDFVYDLHGSIIRDICFLPTSWPWQNSILTGGTDGTCKVSSPDGRVLYAFQTGHSVNSVCITPEPFCRSAEDGFYSLIMSGGDLVSAYVPNSGIQELLKEHKDCPVWKLRYTSNGSTLYSVCDGGILRRYRRYPDRHEYLGEVYRHKGDIQDLDISPYDEYIVTASKDRSVGVLLLGPPNHGFTEYTELT